MYLTPPGSSQTIDPALCQLPAIALSAFAADPQTRRDLVRALGDSLYVFGPDDARGLFNLLSHVFEAKRHWSHLPTLVWCEGGERISAGALDRPPYLLVSPAGSARQPELHAALVEELHPGQVSLPAHLPPCNKFATPPLDVFDVVAEMADATLPPSLRQQPSLWAGRQDEPRGMLLRRALVEHLGTREGHRLDVAACLRSEEPRHPAATAVRVKPVAADSPKLRALLTAASPTGSESSPASSPASTSASDPPASHPMVSAVRLERMNGWAVPASANAGLLPEVHRARVQALADQVRSGGWHEVLDRIAPQLLTRLPPAHPLQMGRVRLQWGSGKQLKFCPLHKTSRQSTITFDPASDRVHVQYLPGIRRELTFSGPDSHLQALIPNISHGLWFSVEETRALLTQLIEGAPDVTALCLLIADRWPDCNPETMLRFCLHGRTLQPAGRQLLDPDAPQRDVTALDVLRWEESERGKGSSPADIAAQGISLAHARWHLGPYGATRAGQDLMTRAGLLGRPMDAAEADFRRQQFLDQLPQLMYEFNALHPMAVFMGCGFELLKQILPEEARDRASEIAVGIREQSFLAERSPGGATAPSAAGPSAHATVADPDAVRQSAR